MRLNLVQLGCAAALLSSSVISSQASAHFRLLKPASWVKEDSQGNPQKVSPCGAAKGDTPELTNAVTTYHAGEEISVEWVGTIAHPGYFRIALAANRDDLKDPTVKQGADCSFKEETDLPKGASGNVLADGILFRSRNGFSEAQGKMFSTKVTLPNEPCENCTLQVMQVMENDLQAISNCYYLHCANLKIVAASGETSADAGSGPDAKDASAPVSDAGEAVKDSGSKPAARDAGSTSSGEESSGDDSSDGDDATGSTNSKDAGKSTKDSGTKKGSNSSSGGSEDKPAASSDSGCSVAPTEARASGAFWSMLALAALLVRRKTRAL